MSRRFRLFTPARRIACAALLIFAFGGEAAAQCFSTGPRPVPVPCPAPPVTSGNATIGSNAAVFDAATRFLQRIAALSSFKTAASTGNNPQGGGADAMAERYRTWFEGYGLASRTDAQGDYNGDHRRSYGGVAGVGVTIVPGATIGFSVDQGHTKVDVAGLSQNGRIDLTQVAAIAAFEHGPWTLQATAVHGFGDVHSERFDSGGTSSASYYARLWGAMAELSYLVALPDNSRFVPKLTFDWIRSHTGAFVETGGATPIAGSDVTASRMRLLVGGEIGHSWLVNRALFDFSIYGRLVDNLSQNIGDLQISDATNGGPPALVTGIRESRLGGDAGAQLSAKVTELARLYAVYDGRFRSNFTSHTGTIGAEFRW